MTGNVISFFMILLGLAGARGARAADSAEPKICDVRHYQARGDGRTKDTHAIQAAIDDCAPGGIVTLPSGGTYLSGTIRLKSGITFRIEPGATLKGSRDISDYPDLSPPTVNTQLGNCRKSLLYAEGASDITIEGGIDGSGDNPAWNGPEKTRPMAIFVVLSSHVTVRQAQVRNAGMWSSVFMEDSDVLIDHLTVDSRSGPTRDGIDIVDGDGVTIQNADVYSEDDSICLKSGSPKGLHNVTVKDSIVRNSLVANALKLGTASTGAFENIVFDNIRIQAVKQAAMAVESVDGSKISGVHFRNIRFQNAGSAFFVLLGRRKGSPGPGSIRDVSFEDIQGQTSLNWGSVASGTIIDGKTYPLQGIRLTNVQVGGKAGGSQSAPPEYAGQYPDPRMWGPMPAFGAFFRHIEGLTLERARFTTGAGDARPELAKDDVTP